MGKLFICAYEENSDTYKCGNCQTHITHGKYMITNQIETAKGECCGFSEIINTIMYKNSNWSFYTKHDAFDMFDDNSILKSKSHSFCVYCKNCERFIGWKYIDCNGEKSILLKSCLT
jgi:hypothetical protein